MSESSRRLLVVDDEAFSRQLVRRFLISGSWTVVEAASTEEARRVLATEPEPAAIILDLVLGPNDDGLDFLRSYRDAGGEAPVIVLTGRDDVETAVAVMKAGAYDFLGKPVSRERLLLAVDHAAEKRALLDENRSLKRRVRQDSFAKTLVGESTAMKGLFAEMERVVETDIPVCLLGETGTGKELVARWLHQNGPRAKGPFVDVNCAAIPETLIESELFGHERGAFTGAVARHKGKLEQADGGTLLLDELGEMSLATQARLLRVLQERILTRVGGAETVPFDLRLVSATQRDLIEAVQEGRFREDLFFRVVVYPIRLPPLRERKEDLALLVHHFIRRFRQLTGRPVEGITPEALMKLEAHDWPGNVRELENAVYRSVVSAGGPFLTTANFPDVAPRNAPRFGPRPYPDRPAAGAAPAAPRAPTPPAVPAPVPPQRQLVTMEDHERAAISQALTVSQGNIKAAADRLGVARSTLYRRIKALGIAVNE